LRKAARPNQPIRQTVAVPQMWQSKRDGQANTNEGCLDKAGAMQAKTPAVTVFAAAYGISATVDNYFMTKVGTPRCGPYSSRGASRPS
jgi:hypothetical protein